MDELGALASDHPELLLITGDLGFGVLDDFRREHPAQFINAGVAEQNMTGMAAGLALSGRTVFTYSIANFPVIRCLEQIRNDVCYHGANVNIVAVGAGLAYGSLGPSHHGTEDVAVLRSLPGMVIYSPGDPVEARWATVSATTTPGPSYLRLGRAGEPIVHERTAQMCIGGSIALRVGGDVTLLSAGPGLPVVMEAAEQLGVQGIDAGVVSFQTLAPFDRDAVIAAATSSALVVSVEEHSVTGGLGSAVAEVLAELDETVSPLLRLGFQGGFDFKVGDQDFLREQAGLDAAGIATSVAQRLARRAPVRL